MAQAGRWLGAAAARRARHPDCGRPSAQPAQPVPQPANPTHPATPQPPPPPPQTGGDKSYSAQFARQFPSVASQFNAGAVRALFEAADFVGFSNYPTLPSVDVQPADLERGFDAFSTELAQFGVDLKRLVRERKTQLFFSEIGVGGGADDYGTSRTSDPQLAARKTFYGVTKPYRHDNDPWHADGESAMKRFLKSFYSAVVAYAESGGVSREDAGLVMGWGRGGVLGG